MGNSLAKDAQLVLRAAQEGDTQLVRSILEKNPRRIKSVTAIKRSSILHVAAKHNLPELILICLDPYVEAVRDEIRTDSYPGPACQKLRRIVNARDVFYRTPLLVAAKAGHLGCVRQLAEYAANLFAIDRDANTALHLAALHERGEVVEYLLAKTRARGILERLVNKRNICGFSALHYAAWRGAAPIVRALLAAGADMSFANDRVFDAYVPVPVGSTPLHLAVTRGSAEVVMALLEYHAVRELEAPPGDPRPPDPRATSNLYGMNPAQLAAHLRHRRLSRLLHPAVPIGTLFTESELSAIRRRGHPMPSLQALASKALQQHLLAALAAALPPSTPAAATPPPPPPPAAAAAGGGGGQTEEGPASPSSRGGRGSSRRQQQRVVEGGAAAASAAGLGVSSSPAPPSPAAAAAGGGGGSRSSRRRKQPHPALPGSPGPAEAGADSEEARSSSRALLRAGGSLRRALPAGSRGLSRVRALLTGCTSGVTPAGVTGAGGGGGDSSGVGQLRGPGGERLHDHNNSSSGSSRLEELAASAPSFYVREAPMGADLVTGGHPAGVSGVSQEVVAEGDAPAAAAAATAAAAAAGGGGGGGGGEASSQPNMLVIEQGVEGSSASSSNGTCSRPGWSGDCSTMTTTTTTSSSSSSSSSSSRPGPPRISMQDEAGCLPSQQQQQQQEEEVLLTSQQTTDLEVVCSSPCSSSSSKHSTGVTRVTSSSYLGDTAHAQSLATPGGCFGGCSGGVCELEPATPVSDAGCNLHTSISDSQCLSDDDLNVCGVCLDALVNVQLQSCQHPLCGGCAERVISMQTTRPAACPFCRLHISGFQALPPESALLLG